MSRLAALVLLSIAVSLLPAAVPDVAARGAAPARAAELPAATAPGALTAPMPPLALTALTALSALSAQAPPAVPPAHTPAIPGAGAPPRSAQAAGSGAAGGGLAFQLPSSWVSEKPSSSMRLAQASIPGKAGPGQFAIFFFGAGGGGSTEDNISRWVGQIDKPVAPPRRQTFTTHGLKVTWVEAAGTMKASTVGMGPATAQPDSRLLAAVVEGPGGPWYLKVVGPDATVKTAQPAFVDLLHALHTR